MSGLGIHNSYAVYKELNEYFLDASKRINVIKGYRMNINLLEALNEGCILSIMFDIFEKHKYELNDKQIGFVKEYFSKFKYLAQLLSIEMIIKNKEVRNYFMITFPIIIINKFDLETYKAIKTIQPINSVNRLNEFFSLYYQDIGIEDNIVFILEDTQNKLFNYSGLDSTKHMANLIEQIEKLNVEIKSLSVNANYNTLLKELNSLIGLNNVKNELKSIINLEHINQLRIKNKIKSTRISHHMVFTGNPGTGKTTVARILGKIYKEIGILSSGHVIEVDRSTLVAGFIGQTAINVKEAIDKAKNGILFIDEAYSLSKESTSSDFGGEAIETLVKYLEDFRDDFIVIVAGYPDEMEEFINSNPGLESRFNNYIHFTDYSSSELVQIFKKFCLDSNYVLEKMALEKLNTYFSECIITEENFSNARFARNLFEKAMKQQANRLIKNAIEDLESLLEITIDDVEGAILC